MKTVGIFFLLFQLPLSSFTENDFAYPAEHKSFQAESFEATVDGEVFVPDEFWAGASQGVIIIQADDEDEAGFYFVFPDNIATGEHELSIKNSEAIQCLYNSGYDSGEAVSGTLRITRHDRQAGRIEAVFAFRGELSEGGDFDVSEGSFALNY